MEKVDTETTKEVLGYKIRKCKPWISKEVWRLIDERRSINQKTERHQIRKAVEGVARRLQRERQRGQRQIRDIAWS